VATLTVQQALEIALQHQNAGRLAEAESLYRRILVIDGNNANALHLLGLISNDRGAREEAVQLIEKAIAIDPVIAILRNSLGYVFHQQGRFDDAIAAYRHAIAIDPTFALAFKIWVMPCEARAI
jgi:protein O-GlcNAc transferase